MEFVYNLTFYLILIFCRNIKAALLFLVIKTRPVVTFFSFKSQLMVTKLDSINIYYFVNVAFLHVNN